MKDNTKRSFSMKDASKWGIAKFGYIKDFAGQVNQFNHLLEGTGIVLSRQQLDSHVDVIEPVYWDIKCRDKFCGNPIEERYRAFKVIPTMYKTASGEDIYGMFVRNTKFGSWEGVIWGTYRSLRKETALLAMPKIGPIVFMTKDQRREFLANIASRAIPEPWSFGPVAGQEEYPILRSYLENTFVKLQKEAAAGKERKLVYSADGTHILFNTDSTQVISKLYEGPYPNYRAVIPQNFERTMQANTLELQNKIRSVISMANARTRQIRLQMDGNNLELSATDPDVGGDSREALAVTHNGEGSFCIGFNGQYLSEILGLSKSEEIVMKMNAPIGACVIEPVGENMGFSFLLMPLRLVED